MARNFGPVSATTSDVVITGRGVLALSGASQSLIAANNMRTKAIISNHSAANPVFLAIGAITAVLNEGIRLAPGANITLEGWTGPVRVIGTAADVVGFVEY